MHGNADLIHRFYAAFGRRDGDEMASLYHPAVEFSDPVFPDLRGERASAMWRMLCARAKDLAVDLSNVQADDHGGSAHWEARYTYSATGRAVHNVIDARFEFEQGKIRRHTDRFDLWRWAGMALGVPGKLLGWTPLLQNTIRRKAAAGLDEWIARGPR